MSYNIIIDRERCIGCGVCAARCKNFEMKDDGKAYAKELEVKEIGCNREAADNCPVDAIMVNKK
ncbi:ferredoxin [Candidatus Woesearchaeota archaeon]|nr:ferredoxin [Candidatus Woesearchaeota archaeon]